MEIGGFGSDMDSCHDVPAWKAAAWSLNVVLTVQFGLESLRWVADYVDISLNCILVLGLLDCACPAATDLVRS